MRYHSHFCFSQEIATKLRGQGELRRSCRVMYGDAELARAFKQSQRGIAEFPEYPPLLRQAISLGRRLLDPVTEFANSCDDLNGNLVLRLHELQDMVCFILFFSFAFLFGEGEGGERERELQDMVG